MVDTDSIMICTTANVMEAMIPPQKLLKVSVCAVTANDEAAARHRLEPEKLHSSASIRRARGCLSRQPSSHCFNRVRRVLTVSTSAVPSGNVPSSNLTGRR